MKLTFNGYEVEIKAKANYHSRANKQDTMNLLNSISIWVMEAGKLDENKDISHIYERISNEIYKQLDANGCYDNLRVH